jgi:hypothetical protein
MSYTEDLRTYARLEKLRMAAMVVAFTCSLLTVAFDHLEWLIWPRALAWGLGGIFAALEARCEKRLGRDPDGSWLRAILFLVIGATFVVVALRD